MASLIFFLTLASPAYAHVPRLVDYCPPEQDARVSGTCLDLIGAAVDFVRTYHSANEPDFAEICVPSGTTAKDALRKIRPWLKHVGRVCGGRCTPASDAITALAASYSCNGLNFMDH